MGSGNLQGIGLMVLGMFGFAVTDVFIKLLGGAIPTGQILMCLGIGGGVAFWALSLRAGARDWRAAFAHPLVITRNIFEVVGTVAFLSGLVLAPLSTVSAIVQANPLIVTIGAALWLKEPVGIHRWSAIFVGLFGVLLVIQPWSDSFVPASLLAVLGVSSMAIRDLVTRRVPPHYGTMQISTFALFLLIPGGVALLMGTGTTLVTPTLTQALLLLAAVAISVVGYFGTTAAMRVGEVGVVTPFRYSRIVFALIFAALVFGERPGAMTYLGAAIIVASGLYTLWREQLRRAR